MKYVPAGGIPDFSARLSELHDYSSSSKALMASLGSYWTAYYADSDILTYASTGSVALYGKQFRRLANSVLQSNIIDIPEYDRRLIDLLVFSEGDTESVYTTLKFSESVAAGDVIVIVYADGSTEDVTVSGYSMQVKGTAEVDSILSADGSPVEFTAEIDSITFSLTAEDNADSILDVGCFTSSLFESEVILERGTHYTVDYDARTITFFVDIFNDEAITAGTYRVDTYPNRKVLLWATDVILNTSHIYDRYGRFLYGKANDSEQYKWFVTALMYFYANTKSIKNLETVLNVIYGVPFAEREGEKVLDVYKVRSDLSRGESSEDDGYWCIETDHKTYYAYEFADILVKRGDVLKLGTLLAKFNHACDYITDPTWYERAPFPSAMLESGAEDLPQELLHSLMENVLKYNTIYIELGVSFQTWKTYQAQLAEIHNILESGIPVYLYPLVGTVFRSIFTDEEITNRDVIDEFGDIKGKLGLVSTVTSRIRVYDGTWAYSGYPDDDHGSHAVRRKLVYNGRLYYSGDADHGPDFTRCRRYDGTVDYMPAFAVLHDADRDPLVITGIGTRIEDKVQDVCDYSPVTGYVYYNGRTEHAGAHTYGEHLLFMSDVVFSLEAHDEDVVRVSDEFEYEVHHA